jgi:O-acetyl-ADP-ribose deacetylase (regulator of RNase III)
MIYQEIKQDIFTVSEDYYLAHCIASDLAMGAGIAVPMNKKFNLREQLKNSKQSLKHPTTILTGRVFNLITKEKSFFKPTYPAISESIRIMREIAVKQNIKKIALPKIGSGLDQLSWEVVSTILKNEFSGTDIELLVCFIA